MGRYDPITSANMCLADETILQCRVPGYEDPNIASCLLPPKQVPNRSAPAILPPPASSAATTPEDHSEAIVIEFGDFIRAMEEVGLAAYDFVLDNRGDILVGHILGRQLSEFGWTGKIRVKDAPGGKHYVIFTGHPGLRKIIKGTRYLSDHTQIVSLGLGSKGLKSVSRVGSIVTFVLVAWEAGTYILNDEKTVYDVTGFVITETMKVSIGLVLAGAATTLVAGATSVVVAPLAAGLVVAIVVSKALDKIDEELQITRALADFFESSHRSLQQQADQIKREYWWWENHLRHGGRLPF